MTSHIFKYVLNPFTSLCNTFCYKFFVKKYTSSASDRGKINLIDPKSPISHLRALVFA